MRQSYVLIRPDDSDEVRRIPIPQSVGEYCARDLLALLVDHGYLSNFNMELGMETVDLPEGVSVPEEFDGKPIRTGVRELPLPSDEDDFDVEDDGSSEIPY